MRTLTCLLVLAFAGPALSATITAPSCALADVNASLGSAADGDTIRIPGGSCTWNGTLNVSKGVAIIGGGSGATTSDTQLVGGRFTISTPSGKTVRVSSVRLS